MGTEINIDIHEERYKQLLYEIRKRREKPDLLRMKDLIYDNNLDITSKNSNGECVAEEIIICYAMKNEDKIELLLHSNREKHDCIRDMIVRKISEGEASFKLLRSFNKMLHEIKPEKRNKPKNK